MKIGKTAFISENIAPPNAKRLAIFDGSKKVGVVAISPMQPNNLGTKLYSFGLVSDLHCAGGGSAERTRLDNALTYFESQGCSFCCHSGDMTNVGFWLNSTDTEMYLAQMAEYKSVRDAHPNLPLYGVCGNHESYSKPIEGNVKELQEYTGHGLYYSMTHGNDVFVFAGQNQGSKPMSDEALQWLYETLETNRNKRCFVFVHPYVSSKDSGNPYGVYGNDLFAEWGVKTTAFTNILRHYKNTLLCHGHSHMHFSMQEEVSNSNYSKVLGFRSLHVPSISWNRKIVNGASVNVGGNSPRWTACFSSPTWTAGASASWRYASASRSSPPSGR